MYTDFCAQNITLETNRETYVITMHSFSLMSLFTNVYVAYVIIVFSPPKMKRYKYHLFYFHFWCSITDLMITTLNVPIIFLPFLMGYTKGLLTWLDVSTWHQFCNTELWYLITYNGCIIIFFYRMQGVIPSNHIFQTTERGFYIICGLYQGIQFIPLTFAYIFTDLKSEETKALYLLEHPCLREILEYPGLLIFDTRNISVLRFEGVHFFYVVLNLFILWLFIYIAWSAIKKSQTFSHKTRQLQRKLIIHRICQFSIPMGNIIVPFTILMFLGGLNVHGTHRLGSALCLSMGMHGHFRKVLSICFKSLKEVPKIAKTSKVTATGISKDNNEEFKNAVNINDVELPTVFN